MLVRVKLFALARQLAGHDVVEVELPDGGTVADLRGCLAAAAPQLAGLMKHLMFAVGNDYASDHFKIPSGADVACIPPVSGG